MPQGCDESQQSRIPQHFTALHIQLQPCTSSLHPFETMDFWFLKQQNREISFESILHFGKTTLYKNPKNKGIFHPIFTRVLGSWSLDQLFSIRALSTSK